MPKIIIFVKTFSHFSSAWLININNLNSGLSFLNRKGYLFQFWKFDNYLFEKFFITLTNNLRFFFLFLFFLNGFKSLNERFGWNNFHQLERENCDFVCLDIFFNHSGKLYDFISTFFLFVLNLPCDFERFMLLTKD